MNGRHRAVYLRRTQSAPSKDKETQRYLTLVTRDVSTRAASTMIARFTRTFAVNTEE